MPFIDCKVTPTLTAERQEKIKSELGKAVSLLHKSENYLMVGFADGYSLYFGGKHLDKGAYVSVSLFGSASSSDYEKMTGEICKILEREAGIPADCVYVTYHGVNDWGWNGSNF